MPGRGSPTFKATEIVHEYKESPPSSDSDDEIPLNLKKRLFGRTKTVHGFIGGGAPADILLWRNKQISGVIVGAVTVVWLLFEWANYHLLTFVCHSLMVSLALLFLWTNAASIVNRPPPKLPEVILPEELFLRVTNAIRCKINRTCACFQCVASGNDLKKFLKVVAGLWILSVIGGWFSFLTLLYLVFVAIFSLPALYEKYEDQVDAAAEKAMAEINNQYAVLDAKVLRKLPSCPFDKKRC